MAGTIGTIGYVVKYAELKGKWEGEKVMGVYTTYPKALARAEQLAGDDLSKMVTDWIISYWWWDSEKSISIEQLNLDEDID